MSGPANNPNNRSRWGSILSGAVAGLESRLDSILADDDQASAKQRAEDITRQEKLKQRQNALKVEQASSRASSRGRPSDRLQERLAKAVVKGTESPRSSSRPASENPSAPDSSLNATTEPVRTSSDSVEPGAAQEPSSGHSGPSSPKLMPNDTDDVEQPSVSELPVLPSLEPQVLSTASISDIPTLRSSQESARPSIDSLPPISTPPTSLPALHRRPSFLEAELSRVTKQHEESVVNYQEELHGYLERIDALQSKLAYLASTATRDAHTVAEEADQGSLKKKLAEKDKKIAQLLEEGQKLSANEIKALGSVRTFRVRLQEEEKAKAELKKRLETVDHEITDAKERTRRAEERDRMATEKLKTLPKLEREMHELKADQIAANATIAELKKMLEEAEQETEDAERRAQTDGVEEQMKIVAELNDELSNSKIEKRLIEDRAKKEINEVRQETARQQEKAKLVELELKSEIQNLEAKLEALRARTEEASSAAPSSAQTALLRQIETLQTQYSLATENWQGIESSLNARIVTLEKDQDEVTRREADIRKKTREANSKVRRLEEELDNIKEQAATLEAEKREVQASLTKTETRLEAAEKTIIEVRAELEHERKTFEDTLQARLEEEKTKWRLETAPSSAQSIHDHHNAFLRAESPTASFSQLRKPSTSDILALHSRRLGGSTAGSRTISSDLPPISPDPTSPPQSRRTSTHPLYINPSLSTRATTESLTGGSNRHDFNPSLPYVNGSSGSVPPSANASVAPSVDIAVGEDPADRGATEISSPHRTVNDLVSVSTVGAGPSVQLVERMSAAVRRLESEKAASKEETARLVAQRDEAREEVVRLMREVDDVKKDKERLGAVEKELEEVKRRYEASLELLGEKQEECEELRNDVLDLKKIYRELVESTVK